MYPNLDLFSERLLAHSPAFHKVVDFNPAKEKLVQLDFTEKNNELSNVDVSDHIVLSAYIDKQLKSAKAKFGIGGYNENRTLYKNHKLFHSPNATASSVHKKLFGDAHNFSFSRKGLPGAFNSSPSLMEKGPGDTVRSIHLGIDIWGEAGTLVYAPLGGVVHSFAFNNNYGDYGATLILLHQIDTLTFYTLYGHLSLEDIAKVSEFQYITRGYVIGHFGKPEDNGHWPPHLHFQVIKDMRMHTGDYPGVCTPGEREKYLSNCPDPNVILKMLPPA